MIDERDFRIPSLLKPNVDVLFIGINPSTSPGKGFKNRFFGGHRNLFWKLLSSSGILPPNEYSPLDDTWIHKYYNVGFTNFVDRATKGQSDIKPREFEKGRLELQKKIALASPSVICFIGTTIYTHFMMDINRKKKWGAQKNYIYQIGDVFKGSLVFVIPSTSNLGTTYTAKDKEKAFRAFGKFLKENGIILSL